MANPEIGSIWRYTPSVDGELYQYVHSYPDAFLFEVTGKDDDGWVRLSNKVGGDKGWHPSYILDYSCEEVKDYKDEG